MNPKEAVAITRYVRALCPQQKFDEFTADAWHDVLAPYTLDDCRVAAAAVAGRQPFVSPAEIIAEITKHRSDTARDIQGPGQPAAVPDADPDDHVAYLAAVRQQRTRAGDGQQLKSRPMLQLVDAVGRDVPAEDLPKPRGPMAVPCPHCGAAVRHPCQRVHSRKRMSGFHDSRIEDARRDEAGLPPVDRSGQQAEVARRIEAARRAAEAEQATADSGGEAS